LLYPLEFFHFQILLKNILSKFAPPKIHAKSKPVARAKAEIVSSAGIQRRCSERGFQKKDKE